MGCVFSFKKTFSWCLLAGLFLALFFPFFTVQADAVDRLKGFAWSENTGWISFNCNNPNYNINTCIGSGAPIEVDYGVDVSSGGNMSGWAWSENMGWIDFSNGTISAGNLGGTATVYNTTVAPFNNGGDEDDGWDGVIELSDTTPYVYGPVLDTVDDTFDGFAWGDENAGWIRFSCKASGLATSTCGTVSYGAELDPFPFSLTASAGLSTSTAITTFGTTTMIWNTDSSVASCAPTEGPTYWMTTNPPTANGNPESQHPSAMGSTTDVVGLVCTQTGTDKTITRAITIYVLPPAPTVTISADSVNIPSGTNTTIRHSSDYVTDPCTASGGDPTWDASSPEAGPNKSYVTENLTATSTIYIIGCDPLNNPPHTSQAVDSIEVYVEELRVSVYASSTNFAYSDKDNMDIYYTTEYAESCTTSSNPANTVWDSLIAGTTTSEIYHQPLSLDDSGTYQFTLNCIGTVGQSLGRTLTVFIGKNPSFSETINSSGEEQQ